MWIFLVARVPQTEDDVLHIEEGRHLVACLGVNWTSLCSTLSSQNMLMECKRHLKVHLNIYNIYIYAHIKERDTIYSPHAFCPGILGVSKHWRPLGVRPAVCPFFGVACDWSNIFNSVLIYFEVEILRNCSIKGINIKAQ